jgi:signal transduction histidine kinase
VGPLNEEQKKQMNMVRGSSRHLLSLVNDVLDISKIEAGQLQVVREPVDWKASIRKVIQATRPAAEKKGLDLVEEAGPEIGTIRSDARRLEQILLNLLGNAVKFTEKGRVVVAWSTVPGSVVLRIEDTGIGIGKEELDRLFQPFQQVDTGLTRKYEGTGLGLSISRKLVELLGGRIWVESEPGKGSVFRFSLPLEGGPS